MNTAFTDDRATSIAEIADMTAAALEPPLAMPDPLDQDCHDDEIVITSRRAICRVALVAAETAGRFERECVDHDPMSWMLAPRRVFDGRAAVDACLDRDDCMRGVLVHGLGLGLDVGRAEVDALLAHEDEDDYDNPLDRHEFRYLYGQPLGRRSASRRRARLRLYSATIVTTSEGLMVQAFHASMATRRSEVLARLVARFGHEVARHADIRAGFHPASPLVIALVPAAVGDLIRQVGDGADVAGQGTFAIDIHQFIRA